MANYPAVPAARMVYDKDGTQVYTIDVGNTVTQLVSADVVKLNNEQGSSATYSVGDGVDVGPYPNPGSLLFFFPELRDLGGYFLAGTMVGNSSQVYVSADTTNGIDGTWTAITTTYQTTTAASPGYRSQIVTTTNLGIRAIKFSGRGGGSDDFSVHTLHLYGEPSPGQNPDRLSLWHPTLDQRISPSYFDWGDVPRSTSADRTFRVKNRSSSLTAHTVQVALDTLTDTSPSVVGQHTLSTDGTTFSAGVTLGDLAPNTISGVLTLRRVTPSNATLSLWDLRILAQAASWS